MKPNIVLICADDIGFNEVGAYQGRGLPDRDVFNGLRVHTPHIDAIGHQGAIFYRHYTTSAICTPSRYTILTGRYASRSPGFLARNLPGQQACIGWDTPIDPTEGTIGTVLKELGYTTGFIGKWHNGEPRAEVSTIQSIKNPYDPNVTAVIRPAHQKQQDYLRTGFGFDFVDRVYFGNREGFPDALQGHNLEWLAEGAEQFIRANRDHPFYLHLALSTPHGDYPTTFVTQDPRITPAGVLDKAPNARMPPREKLLERLKAANIAPRTAMSAWQDECVGAVLQCLEECRLTENTIVIFTGDHLGRGKYTCYEGCRVPFLIRWPKGIRPGSQINSITAHVDLVSTLAEMSGGRVPSSHYTDGRSFVPLLVGNVPCRDRLLLEVSNIRAIVTERWKYIACRASEPTRNAIEADRNDAVIAGRKRWVGWDGKKNPHPQFETEGVRYFDAGSFEHYFDPDQLYDLQADVFERHNLATRVEYSAVVAELKHMLAEELRQMPHRFGEFTVCDSRP